MNKKYELTDESIKLGRKRLYRIKALRDFGNVSKGDLGGFVESENNLSHEGECWIYDHGKVIDQGFVSDNGVVFDYGIVSDNGEVRDNGVVRNCAIVYGNGVVSDHGEVAGYGRVLDYGEVSDNAVVSGDAEIWGNSVVKGNTVIKYENDCSVFKHNWTCSSKSFAWDRLNYFWTVTLFHGTGEKLIEKEYDDGSEESRKNHKSYLKLVEEIFLN